MFEGVLEISTVTVLQTLIHQINDTLGDKNTDSYLDTDQEIINNSHGILTQFIEEPAAYQDLCGDTSQSIYADT